MFIQTLQHKTNLWHFFLEIVSLSCSSDVYSQHKVCFWCRVAPFSWENVWQLALDSCWGFCSPSRLKCDCCKWLVWGFRVSISRRSEQRNSPKQWQPQSFYPRLVVCGFSTKGKKSGADWFYIVKDEQTNRCRNSLSVQQQLDKVNTSTLLRIITEQAS